MARSPERSCGRGQSRSWRALVAIGLSAAATAAACSDIVGVEVLPQSRFPYAESGCHSCIYQHCQLEEQACAADPDCRPLASCMAACGVNDWQCRADCEVTHPKGVSTKAGEELDSCRRVSCRDACIGPRAPQLSVYDGAKCTACLEDKCAERARACIEVASCERFMVAVRGCDDPECVLFTMWDVVGEFVEPAKAFAGCAGYCSDVCPFGQVMECIGDYAFSPPQPKYGWMDYDLVVGDVFDRSTAGLEVRQCVTNSCEQPVVPADHGHDDHWHPSDDGLVSMQLFTGEYGFVGHLLVTGDLAVDEPIYPMLIELGRPLTRYERFHSYTAISVEVSEQAASDRGVALDEGAGHIIPVPVDCVWSKAFPSVTFDIDADHYRPNTLVTRDDEGITAIFNVEPGEVTLTGRLLEGTVHSTQTITVVADTTTRVWAIPNPK